MPLMNGFDLAAAVKRIAPDCEVIFFTGHLNLAEMYAEIGDAGEYCVMLTKPIHPANLLEHVYCVLEQRGRALQPVNHALSLRLYEYLSSVVRGGEVGLSAWGLTPGAVATRSRAVSLKAPSVFPDSGRDQFSSTAR
jgi:DNA-binding response OmpR family regulator